MAASQDECQCRVYEKGSVVQGHHIYKTIWTPVLEELTLQTEDGNEHDKPAVAIMKEGCIVGHVPCSIAKVFCFFFLKRGGEITYQVIGKRKLGVGLEVPCMYLYSVSARMIERGNTLLAEDSSSLYQSCPY